eukprot:s393_g30.t1
MLRCAHVLVTSETLLMLPCADVLVTSETLLMLRCAHVLLTSETLLMLRCAHVLVTSEPLFMLRCAHVLLTSKTLLMLRCAHVYRIRPVALWLALFLVFLFFRAALKANAAERLMILKGVCAVILVVLFMFGLFGVYLYTDCHNEFRGSADVLLAICFFCVLSSFQFLVRAFFVHFAVPKLDGFLEIVAEAGNRGDQRNLLILEVREDAGLETLRSFWEQQLQQDPAYVRNVQLSCPWLTYCSWVLLAVIPLLFIYAYGARTSLFLCMLWFRACVYVARFYILRLPSIRRWFHQRSLKNHLANVPPQLSVVLFHNNRAEGLDQPAPLNDIMLMSAAFFSETQVFFQHSPGSGERMFPSVITRTSILQNNNSWQLRFATSCRRSNQTMFQTARTEVEGTQFFPLEEQDVDIPPSLEGLIILNIPSFGGGTDLWGRAEDEENEQDDRDSDSDSTAPSVSSVASCGRPCCGRRQSMQDGQLEVVGVHGALQLGASQVGLYQAQRLAQGLSS